MSDTPMRSCPECARSWEMVSEQSACIDVLGACLACKSGELTDSSMLLIHNQREKLAKAEAIWINHLKIGDPDPAPKTICLQIYRDHCLNNFEGLADLVLSENARQIEKWGVQERTAFEWMNYLAEEFGELAQAVNDHESQGFPDKLKDHVAEEAVQVATLALKICEMYLEAKESTKEINGWVKGGRS